MAAPITDSTYHQLVDNVSDYALYMLDANGHVASWNRGATHLKGYTADEIIGESFARFYTDEDRERGIPEIALKAATAQGQYSTEGWRVRKDGSRFWASVTIYALHDSEGALTGFAKITRNSQERLEMESRVRDQATRLQAIMDTVLDGLITIDQLGKVQSLNAAAARMFGYQEDEVVGRNVSMLMPEPYYSEDNRYIENYLTTETADIIGIGREASGRRKDGSIFPMELGINEMRIKDERMFVGTVRDISARKRDEESIRNYIEALKLSNRELDDFAYIASHDLKEPLRGVNTNVSCLKEDYADKLDADGIRRFDRMVYLCNRMEKLIDDLLYFSRLGRQELAVQDTNLNTIVRDIEAMMESTLREKNASIRIPKPLPTILCDLPRVTEAFRNLITNAVKYNDKPEKWVEIGCTDQNGQRTFYIKDNGIGIAKDFHEEVFRIFKRLNAEDDSVKGTGVGLTFVRKIIERHGGNIWIESEPGTGTTFYFTLNEAREAQAA